MTISDWLVIAAIVVAPILAVQVQKFIKGKKEIKRRKMQIFGTLMTTRANPLLSQHVQALNMIDIEFFGEKKVIDAWKLLLDSYTSYPQDAKDQNYQTQLNLSMQKSGDLLIDLLAEMAKSLNYSFDKVHIKRGAYLPKCHVDYIGDQEFIRHALVGVLSGQVPIPVKVVNMPGDET